MPCYIAIGHRSFIKIDGLGEEELHRVVIQVSPHSPIIFHKKEKFFSCAKRLRIRESILKYKDQEL
jgi:hypothetical protein